MTAPARPAYLVRVARTQAELRAAQALRARAFDLPCAQDGDAYDARCKHFLIYRQSDDMLVCCFRIMTLDGAQIAQSYSAQYYELSALQSFDGPMVELGRFCVHPDVRDPDVLRVAWGAVTAHVDAYGVKLLFGCSSFAGTQADDYLDAFAMLKARHLAPKRWLPKVKAPDVFRFAARLRRRPDARKAMRRMPPLLRTYLLMGGWVSDHAVVDRQMNTMHVFTGLEIGAIPARRKMLLRSVAAALPG